MSTRVENFTQKIAPRTDATRDFHPYLLATVLLIALAARVHVFGLTADQPVWWDEAEYMIKARNLALGMPDTGFTEGRALGLPIAMAGLYALGVGEVGLHVFEAVIAFAAVWLLYRVGRRLFGTLAGFAAALLFSLQYMPLFYGARILTEMPQVTMCLLAADLITARTPVRMVLAAPVLVVVILTRYPAGLMLPILFVYLVTSAGIRVLRSRTVLYTAGVGLLIAAPYLVWAWARYGNPLHAFAVWGGYAMPPMSLGARLLGIVDYARLLWTMLGWVLGALFVAGLIVCSRSVVRLPQAVRDGNPVLSARLFVIAWVVVPVLYFGFFVSPVLDRYVILSLPAVFLAIAIGLVSITSLLTRGHATITTALVVAVATLTALPLARTADAVVRNKNMSFSGLRDAGLWIHSNSDPTGTTMSASVAQLTYYSLRQGVAFPADETTFVRELKDKPPAYIVVSQYEPHPPWLQRTLGAMRFQVVKQLVADDSIVLIFKPPAQ